MTHSSEGDADLKEVRVVGVVLLRDLASVSPEDFADELQILCRLNHQLARLTLGDLDVLLEESIVLEASLERRNGHGLRDSAEVEHTLLSETCEIVQAVVCSGQRSQNHL